MPNLEKICFCFTISRSGSSLPKGGGLRARSKWGGPRNWHGGEKHGKKKKELFKRKGE